MRIALFTETYTPYINGGVVHVRLLKKGLEELGHEVLVVTASPKVSHHVLKDGVLYCPAVEIKKIYGYGLASPISPSRLKWISDFNPDIIHIHNEFGIGLFGLNAAKKLGIPSVYTVHTMYDDYTHYVMKGFAGTVDSFMSSYLKLLAKNSTAIIGPSEKVVAFLHRHGVDRRVFVIDNCPDVEALSPANADYEKAREIRARYGVPQDAKLLTLFCRIAPEKSIDVLIDYFAKEFLKDPQYYLMIIGEGASREDLMRRAESLGLSDRVIFTGAVLNADIPPYIHAADAFVTASTSEMFSISMLEAQSAGLPAFVRHDPYNDCQIQEGVNGFIYHDSDEFGTQIRAYFAKSPEEIREFSEGVVASVAGYGVRELAEKVLDVYQYAQRRYRLLQQAHRKSVRISPVSVRIGRRHEKKNEPPFGPGNGQK